MPIKDLYGALEKQYPGIRKAVLDSCAVTVNLEYVDVEQEEGGGEEGGVEEEKEKGKGAGAMMIEIGDEVAIIPPVSSG